MEAMPEVVTFLYLSMILGVIAIDGKTSQRTHDQAAGKKAFHLLSAWAVENRMALAQLATEEKSNEITAIPLLLQQVALAGCIVTVDAMGTQTKIAQQIIEQEGEYTLARKREPGQPLRRGESDLYSGGTRGVCHRRM
jgi:hypothetical protein